MRRLLSLAVLLAFIPSLVAQSSTDREKALARLKLMMMVDNGCPVAVSTQRRAPYTMVATGLESRRMRMFSSQGTTASELIFKRAS